ncbi:MAG TPA: FIST N-terminal domain-containing protein [Rugosimonospora sp.]|nr:FIST N-terminal domain-containing protein [Rugosimonospora sp.]
MSALRLGVPQWTRAVQGASGRRRWLAIGRSSDPDPRRAGAYAAARALVASDPVVLIVFCSGATDPSAVLAGIADIADGVPLVGCSAEAVLGPDGPGGGVLVTALGGSGMSVATAAESGVVGRQREAGARAARCAVPPPRSPHQALVLLTNGDAASQEAILAGAYSVVGAAMPMVGGAASPGPADERTYTLYGREVLPDAVVAAAIGSDGPFGVGIRHGFHRVGEPMIVTSSSGGLVRTLDDRPALATYLTRLGAPAQAYVDVEAFEQFAATRPVGVRRRTTLELRDVSYGEYLRDGFLYTSGDIPEGGMIWLMEGDEESNLVAGEEAGSAAVAALDGAEPLGAIAFDCTSRGALLGDVGMHKEVDRLSAAVGGAPLAGFYTWGEIARVRGIFGYHNQTMVVLALG